MTRQIACYAHIPYIRLPKSRDDVSLSESSLVRLSFSAWQTLSGVGGFHRDDYDRTDPTFFKIVWQENESDDPFELYSELWPEFENESYFIYFFLLLVTRARLPEPDLSVRYYSDSIIKRVLPEIGAFYLEAVAYTKPSSTYELNEAMIASINDLMLRYPLTLNNHPLNIPEIRNAKDVLMRLSRPEFSLEYDFVFCVAAIESILVPAYEKNTSKVFSSRGATLFSQGDTKMWQGNFQCFNALYDLRSRIVHGDKHERQIQELSSLMNTPNVLSLGRSVLCSLIQMVMALQQKQGSSTDFTMLQMVKVLDDSEFNVMNYQNPEN
jgi:hypothetical protein